MSSGWIAHKTPHMIDDTYLVQLSVMLINIRFLTAWGTELWWFFWVEAVGLDFSSGFFCLGEMLPPLVLFGLKLRGRQPQMGGIAIFYLSWGELLMPFACPHLPHQ